MMCVCAPCNNAGIGSKRFRVTIALSGSIPLYGVMGPSHRFSFIAIVPLLSKGTDLPHVNGRYTEMQSNRLVLHDSDISPLLLQRNKGACRTRSISMSASKNLLGQGSNTGSLKLDEHTLPNAFPLIPVKQWAHLIFWQKKCQ